MPPLYWIKEKTKSTLNTNPLMIHSHPNAVSFFIDAPATPQRLKPLGMEGRRIPPTAMKKIPPKNVIRIFWK